MMRLSGFIFSLVLFAAVAAEARIFSFDDVNVGAYFRGTGGLSMMGQEAFSLSSGDQTYFDNKDKPNYNFGGEIGVLLQVNEKVALRIGVEGLQSRNVEAAGKDASDVKLLDVESKIVAFIPGLTFEFSILRTPATKTYFFAGAGYVQVKGTNDYTMTAAGTTEYGANSYKETVSGTSTMIHSGVGFETQFVDNATLSIEGGWRQLMVDSLKHENSMTTVQGSVTEGQDALKNDGGKRHYDMGGPFVGIALKFYIPPLR